MKNGATLHQRLRQARLQQRLTLRDVERLTQGQITNGYVSQLERGVSKDTPTPEKLRHLARVLKLPFLELLLLAGHVTLRELRQKL